MTFDFWPALLFDPKLLPPFAEYGRAVWGKVHGAPTDFRWIARSRDFASGRSDLHAQLNLGSEDLPERFQAWRTLGDRCYAITVYPSRAADASGRRGFVEKQVLEWRRPPHIPATLGALLFLPHAAQLTDEIWWNQYTGELWSQPDLFLPLEASDHTPLAIGESTLRKTIERGRAELRESVPSLLLEQLYDQLLAGRQPALLSGLSRPLSAEALAALLLPLPREIADHISIAAWIPSQQQELSSLGRRWNVLVTTKELPAAAIADVRALLMAKALLTITDVAPRKSEENSPIPIGASIPQRPAAPIRPGLKVELTALDRGAAPLFRELYDFASDSNRRWLAPESLRHAALSLRPGDPSARVIRSWVAEVRAQEPADAHREQWSAKVDLLRSAAIVLDPDAATVQAVSFPERDSRVPALLFALVLSDRSQWDALAKLGQRALREALAQSTNCCAPYSLRSALGKWLEQWRSKTQAHDINVRGLITEALTQTPA